GQHGPVFQRPAEREPASVRGSESTHQPDRAGPAAEEHAGDVFDEQRVRYPAAGNRRERCRAAALSALPGRSDRALFRDRAAQAVLTRRLSSDGSPEWPTWPHDSSGAFAPEPARSAWRKSTTAPLS